jgi:protein-tyrosine phosphatase
MDEDEIIAEAQWVVARLRQGQSVLVHCVAGFIGGVK